MNVCAWCSSWHSHDACIDPLCECEEGEHPNRPARRTVLNAAEGEARREAAIHRVDEHGDPEAKEELLRCVQEVARRNPRFTTDLVWELYAQGDVVRPHEPRLLGVVMRIASANEWIAPTDDFDLSARPETHRNPKRVWVSLVYQPVPTS